MNQGSMSPSPDNGALPALENLEEPHIVLATATDDEAQAVKEALDLHADPGQGEYPYRYEFQDDFGNRLSYATTLWPVGMGNVSAAVGLMRQLGQLAIKPCIALLLGTAGSLKVSDAPLLSVVVAERVGFYEMGKVETDESFGSRPRMQTTDAHLISKLKQLLISERRPTGNATDGGVVEWRISLVASGEKIWKTAGQHMRQRVAVVFDDAIAIEMEGYGFMQAVEASGIPYGLVIRGISDALSDKDKANRSGSAHDASWNAAKLAGHILGNIHPQSHWEASIILKEADKAEETYEQPSGRLSTVYEKVDTDRPEYSPTSPVRRAEIVTKGHTPPVLAVEQRLERAIENLLASRGCSTRSAMLSATSNTMNEPHEVIDAIIDRAIDSLFERGRLTRDSEGAVVRYCAVKRN